MIYVLGSINVDLVMYTKYLPEPGETLVGEEFYVNLGGKGANQAVAAAKAGANVVFIGRVGGDYFGEVAVRELSKFNVLTKVAIDRTVSTGIALINVSSTGENSITIIPGANAKVSSEELTFLRNNLKKSDFLLIQGEVPTDIILSAAKIAFEVDAIVIFDPTPIRKDLDMIIPFTTFVTPNEIELRKLTRSGSLEELLDLGAKNVILKMGDRGAMLMNRGQEIIVNAFPVGTVDSTGAGDAFNGAFASALSKDVPIEQALVYASAAAAISVTRKGAAVSSPYKDEINEFLLSRKE